MRFALIVTSLLAPILADEKPAADEAKQKSDALRSYYARTAARYEFFHDAARKLPLALTEKPLMTWTNDGDWSGDVFAWSRNERPEVIGCLLTGPARDNRRIAFQEFHLLADEAIAPTDMLGEFRWAPREGLKLTQLKDAPEPAESAALRLAQMRRLVGEFSAHIEADSTWELRLLPQPLLRYQPKEGPVIDGALFTYVWTKGTDPELLLLLECRQTDSGRAWFYAPVRFTYREVWLEHHHQEVWRGAFHREQPGGESTMIYTTRYLATFSIPD